MTYFDQHYENLRHFEAILLKFCMKNWALKVSNSRQSVTRAHIYEVKRPVFEAQKVKE